MYVSDCIELFFEIANKSHLDRYISAAPATSIKRVSSEYAVTGTC